MITYTPATEIWRVAPIRWDLAQENNMSRRIYNILLKWLPFANEHFQDWDVRPNSGHFFGGTFWYQSDSAQNSLIYAVLSKLGEYDEQATKISRNLLKERAIKAIRYIGFTHDTGPEDCVRVEGVLPYTSGKKWGGRGDNFFMASQNGRSIAFFAYAAWMLWDDLDQETKLLVQNVVSSYADQWSIDQPRDGVYYDTQCEENGWTAAGIGASVALFPDHPHHEQWMHGFRLWAMNSVSTYKDRLADPSGLIDIPAGNLVRAVTFHPDMTAENHAFVHPSYMCAGTNLRGIFAMMSLTAGQEIPREAVHNNEKLYERTIKIWAQFDGLAVPVQGQDWWYNRQHERQLTHTILNVIHGNRDAANLVRGSLDSIERIQASNSRGCLLEERGEECIINKAHAQFARDLEHGSAVDLLCSYLIYLFGGPGAEPSDTEEMTNRLLGVYTYSYGNSILHRRKDSFASFSWRNNVMALTLPSKGLWQVTPLYASYTGTMEFAEKKGNKNLSNESIIRDVERESILPFYDGFAATVTIARGDRELLQHAAFLSLPNGSTVYIERFDAMKNITIHHAQTGIIGIRNENYAAMPELAPGTRTLYHPEGADKFRGFYGQVPNQVETYGRVAYVNVDDYIGYVIIGGQGVKYINKHEYLKWKGVEDILVLNDIGSLQLTAGQTLEPFIVVSMPNQTAARTESASRETVQLDTNDETIVVETEDCIVAANFRADVVRTIAQKRIIAGMVVNVYEGRQAIRGESYFWNCCVPAFSSLYRKAVCQLSVDPALQVLLDITVADGRMILINECEMTVSCKITFENGRSMDVTVAAGGCHTLEV